MHRTVFCAHALFRKRFLPLVVLLPAAMIVLPHAAPVAAGQSKFLGNITPSYSSVPANFSEYWSQLTPENAGKWGSVERRRNTMSWRLDTAYRYAKDNHLLFKQHTFIWGNQVPSWMEELAPEEQAEEVEEWIQLFCERYTDIDFIDVVNEPVNSFVSYCGAIGGQGETGWDWIIWAFEKARHYCPKAKLLINEFNLINDPDVLDRYLEIIMLLQERDLIDGIGMQSHCWSLEETAFTPEIVKNTLDRLAETGLPVYTSELDIRGDDTTQLANYRRIFPAYWEHPAVAGVTLWGWIEGATWLDSTYLLRRDGTERPALAWLREYVTDMAKAEIPSVKSRNGPLTLQAGPGGSLRLLLDCHAVLTLRIVDLQGRTVVPVKTLSFPPGTHDLPAAAIKTPPGIYIVIAETGGETQRFIWIRPGSKERTTHPLQ